MSKNVVLSGMRPTGLLHLGNYFGALENYVRLQDENDCYFFVADWHALTTGYEDTSDIKSNIESMVIDWLSAGLDPEKCAMFLQSDIKEHAELHLLFSMITPLSWLERCPTYKDQIAQMTTKDIQTYGFLGYPCLMTADILAYLADAVPVGEDQLPHLELTREIARRFNFIYGQTFPEPAAILTKAKVLPGTDGRKMSKSYNNTILLSDPPEVIAAKVSGMITDPARIRKTDPGHPDVCAVYAFHRVFNEAELPEIEASCKAGQIGCVACKKNLAAKVAEYMAPIHERRAVYAARKNIASEVLAAGNERARVRAQATLAKVRKAMKIG